MTNSVPSAGSPSPSAATCLRLLITEWLPNVEIGGELVRVGWLMSGSLPVRCQYVHPTAAGLLTIRGGWTHA